MKQKKVNKCIYNFFILYFIAEMEEKYYKYKNKTIQLSKINVEQNNEINNLKNANKYLFDEKTNLQNKYNNLANKMEQTLKEKNDAIIKKEEAEEKAKKFEEEIKRLKELLMVKKEIKENKEDDCQQQEQIQKKIELKKNS